MKILVGSASERKIEIVKNTIEEITHSTAEVFGIKAVSGVPETPWNKETYEGAHNRALFCIHLGQIADFYIGVESGIIERYGHIYEEAWAVIITSKNEEYAGYSSGLKVPDIILNKMKSLNLSHNEVMDMLDKEKAVLLKHETWGNYTNGLLLREISIAESIRNAAVQVFSDENSFYKQK